MVVVAAVNETIDIARIHTDKAVSNQICFITESSRSLFHSRMCHFTQLLSMRFMIVILMTGLLELRKKGTIKDTWSQILNVNFVPAQAACLSTSRRSYWMPVVFNDSVTKEFHYIRVSVFCINFVSAISFQLFSFSETNEWNSAFVFYGGCSEMAQYRSKS